MGLELAAGATVYLTQNRAWHAAINAAFEFHSGKRSSDDKVGTLLTLEGGVGRDILKGAGSVGLSYSAQMKLTEDKITGLPPFVKLGKNNSFALGPEVNLPLIVNQKFFGSFTFRYQFETYARTSLQGNVLVAMVTFFLKPINLRPNP